MLEFQAMYMKDDIHIKDQDMFRDQNSGFINYV
jgi:hypothetical protein